MIFLVEYDRSAGKIVEFKRFDSSARQQAEACRLSVELELGRNHVQHEVALFEAEDEASLRRTHRRYFEDLGQLLDSPLPI